MGVSSPNDGPLEASEKKEPVDILLQLAEKRFLHRRPDASAAEKVELQGQILQMLEDNDMAPLLASTCAELKCAVDARQLEALRARVADKVQELEAKVQDAEEKDGETEVRDALIALADYVASTGDREAAYQAYARAEQKTAGAGLKMDQVFRKIRLDILWGNWLSVKDNLATAEKLCESGGDWERKNRLKVYRAVHAMATRDFKTAADLLLGAVATFTTTELFSYEQCIFYAVITSSVALDRVSIKKRVVDSPEILTVIHRLPSVESLINSLHSCNYHEFLQAFVGVLKQLSRDMYLAPHLKYFTREMRVVVYSQYLESYKSVTLQSMASAFGVSEEFVDTEISNFIVEGRISAKIDKVSGIIETSRLDAKNTLYQQTLRQGDLLLNRIQKLSKIIDVE